MATSPLSDTSKVADWSTVPTAYQDAVSVCYNMGMLSGVDGKGTFNGNGVMTRAQAAVVMDRLIGDEQVAPPTPGEIPDGALAITERSQLTNACGAMPYPGGFHLDSRTVSYGGSNIRFDSKGYSTVTFTFTASDKDVRISYGVHLLGNTIWDPTEARGVDVVPAGETRVLSFDCSGSVAAGFYIERDDAIGNFAEGWITNMYLS